MFRSISKTILFLILLSFCSRMNSQENIQMSEDTLTQKEQKSDTFSLSRPEFITTGIKVFFKTDKQGVASLDINGEKVFLTSKNGLAEFPYSVDRSGKLYLFSKDEGFVLYHISADQVGIPRIKPIPFYLSVFPPLVAILCALIFKEVLFSLFLGVWAGVFILEGLRVDSLFHFFLTIWKVVQTHVVNALTNPGHMSIIVFSMLIGGMVALISKNGGMGGIVKKLSKYAKDKKSSQMVTWFLGIVVFFDDYANTLVVGNTMRPISDSYRISREKLSYLVDSTAAPVASIAFITTWIGAQLAYIQSGMENLGQYDVSPYSLYFSSLQYAFYPVLTIVFMLILILSGKDFGPMYHAEQRAANGYIMSHDQISEDEPNMEDLSPVKGASLMWHKAALPVFTVVFVTLFALMETGFSSLFVTLFPEGGVFSWSNVWNELHQTLPAGENGFFVKLGKVIGSADSYISLLWASLSGLIVAIVLTLVDKTMKLFSVMHWVTVGFKTMLPALLILTLAWALASVTEELHTAEFISMALAGNVSPMFMPPLVFILSFLIAFSTGSSWSTMAIFYPIAIPATYAVCMEAGMSSQEALPYIIHVISIVLAAAVFGDHCSPISDTTILSSLASDCNHLDHVKTQMPYAVTVGLTALFLSFIAALVNGGLLFNLFLFGLGGLILYFVVRILGKKLQNDF